MGSISFSVVVAEARENCSGETARTYFPLITITNGHAWSSFVLYDDPGRPERGRGGSHILFLAWISMGHVVSQPSDYHSTVERPLHFNVPELGISKVPFTRTIYSIEPEDFRREDSKDCFRLDPGKTVGLFGAQHPITCTSYETGPNRRRRRGHRRTRKLRQNSWRRVTMSSRTQGRRFHRSQ
jgi:hypothetical protein